MRILSVLSPNLELFNNKVHKAPLCWKRRWFGEEEKCTKFCIKTFGKFTLGEAKRR